MRKIAGARSGSIYAGCSFHKSSFAHVRHSRIARAWLPDIYKRRIGVPHARQLQIRCQFQVHLADCHHVVSQSTLMPGRSAS